MCFIFAASLPSVPISQREAPEVENVSFIDADGLPSPHGPIY